MKTLDPALAEEQAHKERVQKSLIEALSRNDSTVAKFYDDAVVFITGGSGFLGKQLVEKLFRACNIKKVFFLLRGKKGKTPETRIKDILEDPVYDVLRKDKPNFGDKMIPIVGDVMEKELGLSEQNWKIIAQETNVIFHLAATVNFQEEIQRATFTNIRGTRDILRLAKECCQLRSMVHVSTAYAHATSSRVKKTIHEDFEPVPVYPDDLITLAENNQKDDLNDILKTRGSDWPNTYTFTKAVAEEVVRTKASDLPICIVRPAIGVAAFREPSPGWLDTNSVYSATGIVLGAIIGIIHTLMADLAIRIDMVPVDYVSNALIAAAWDTARTHARGTRTKIYTVSNTRSPMYCATLDNTLNRQARDLISPRTVWYCFTVVTTSRPVYMTLNLFLHVIPAWIVDGVLIVIGQKPRFSKVYKKVDSLFGALYHFMTHDWNFEDNNTVALYDQLSETDQSLFDFNLAHVDPIQLIVVWILGIRRYIIKDDVQNTVYGLRKQFWLKITHYVVMTLYVYLMYKLFTFVMFVLGFVFSSVF